VLKSKAIKELMKYLCSFLLGATLVFLFAFKQEQVSSKSSFEFGDMKFSVVDTKFTFNDVNVLEKPIKFDQALNISKGNSDFIQLFKDPSGKVFSFLIRDSGDIFVMSHFDKDRISDFSVYGNKVHDNKRMPVFYIKASEKKSIWQSAMYTPSFKKIIKNGMHISYSLNGESYEDIDFNGQFDVKQIWNEKGEIISDSIFLEGKWIELGNTYSDEKLRKKGYYSFTKSEAKTLSGKDVIYYDFEYGKGWKKRSDDDKRDN
jgi:hypothetical protein